MKRLILALAIAAMPLAAAAHEMAKGPNGGPVVDSAGHHVEMVANGHRARPVPHRRRPTSRLPPPAPRTPAPSCRTAARPRPCQLQPAEPNRLVGALAAPLGQGRPRGRLRHHGRRPRRPGPLRQQLTSSTKENTHEDHHEDPCRRCPRRRRRRRRRTRRRSSRGTAACRCQATCR